MWLILIILFLNACASNHDSVEIGIAEQTGYKLTTNFGISGVEIELEK